MKKLLLSGVALMVLAIGPAVGADLGRPVYKSPPPAPPPPVQDWSGVYVGLEGGYGWGKQDFDPAFNFFHDPTFPAISSVSQSGWLAGGFAGVQKQWGSWVLGLEAEIDWADITGSTTATATISSTVGAPPPAGATVTATDRETINSKINELGYVGPKVGWAFSPNWMVYATGGVSWAHKEDTANESSVETCVSGTQVMCISVGGPSPVPPSQSGGLSMFGWAAGGGLDYKWELDPGSAVIFGVKYLHYGFGNDTLTLTDDLGSGTTFGLKTKESVDVVTGRISYLFSIH